MQLYINIAYFYLRARTKMFFAPNFKAKLRNLKQIKKEEIKKKRRKDKAITNEATALYDKYKNYRARAP